MKVWHILFIAAFKIGVLSTNAWDIAVAVGDQIQFLNTTGQVDGILSEGMSEVRALTYNSELRHMYFSDNDRPEGSIFKLMVPDKMNVTNQTAKVHTVVSKQVHQVKGVAYDDRTGILYWSNGQGHAILWIRVETTDQPQAGQPLLRVDDQIPMGIAIDTCKRFLYWTNCGRIPSIERSLLDGSQRETLVNKDLTLPYAVVVDQMTERLYWVDERPGFEFRIESTNLNGQDRKILIDGSDHQPFALAISGQNVFWADHIHTSVWRVPLDTPHSTSAEQPVKVNTYKNSPQALASARSGVWTREHCNPVIEPEMKVIPATVTVTKPEVSTPLQANKSHPICFNKGIWLTERDYCDCLPGYSGALCEIDHCRDYCVHGTCHVDHEGLTCQCSEGFTGPRCEISICHNYCVNGSCSIDLKGEAQCHCQEGYTGDRCQINFMQHQELKDNLLEICSAFCKLWTQSSKSVQPFDVCSCPEESDIVPPLETERREYTMIALLTLCSVLMIIVAILIKKVFVLGKRPRIKKRIIVNKKMPPHAMTCRPSPSGGDQCEITIENCCNMNICETPCFEPDFRQPQGVLTKGTNRGGKEEKKTLLGNMELPPDDLY